MSDFIQVVMLIGYIGMFIVGVYVVYYLIKTMKNYNRKLELKRETNPVLKNLGSTIKEKRTQAKMTQEFVAESLGVSRQAVSKWETGTSDPSTRNLIELANLFDIDAKELLS